MQLLSNSGDVLCESTYANNAAQIVEEAVSQGISLHNANLYGARLSGLMLDYVDLSESCLDFANLYSANLKHANLNNASLHGAILQDVDFTGADLRRCFKVYRFGIDNEELIIPNIHQAVYAAANQPNALQMFRWHSCTTTHCRAGWVVTLAGAAGRALEWVMGTAAAATIIYMLSDPTLACIPNFYARKEVALEDMKRLAEEEANRVSQ
jgi:Pentapeptide repeats (8 copies)